MITLKEKCKLIYLGYSDFMNGNVGENCPINLYKEPESQIELDIQTYYWDGVMSGNNDILFK